MHIRIQDPEILIQGLQSYSSNYKYIPVMFSSNRIKIQVILLILQLETDYFSKLFISEMHSKQWYYSLHRDFQNCYSTRRKSYRISSAPIPAPIPTPILQGYPYTIHIYTCTLQRILHPENPILHAEDKELFEYYYYIQRAKRPSFQIPEKKFYA